MQKVEVEGETAFVILNLVGRSVSIMAAHHMPEKYLISAVKQRGRCYVFPSQKPILCVQEVLHQWQQRRAAGSNCRVFVLVLAELAAPSD
jgi:hypothetical protein